MKGMRLPHRYLLLEDQETGDVLMPLIYMKPIFEANYSRKLSSLKNRLVEQQEGGALPRSSTSQLYWVWAFESPQNVKLLVRQQLGEQNVSHVSKLSYFGTCLHRALARTCQVCHSAV